MIFTNKAALDKNQIIAAAKDGFTYIEFHTTLQHFKYTQEELIDIRQLLDSLNLTCVALHLPIHSEGSDKDILSTPSPTKERRLKFLEISKKAIEMMEILSSYTKPIIVAHVGYATTYEPSKPIHYTRDYINAKLQESKDDLIHLSNYITERHSNIIFTVENMPSYGVGEDSKAYYWFHGFDKNFANFIQNINKENIGVCLDITHCESTIRKINMTNFTDKPLTICDFIEDFSSVTKHIHLNNTLALGDSVLYADNIIRHSAPFTATDERYLETILYQLTKSNIDCSITLEIAEQDFINRPLIKETKNTLNTVLRKLHLEII